MSLIYQGITIIVQNGTRIRGNRGDTECRQFVITGKHAGCEQTKVSTVGYDRNHENNVTVRPPDCVSLPAIGVCVLYLCVSSNAIACSLYISSNFHMR